MVKSLNKGISSVVGILIILICALLAGVLVWEYQLVPGVKIPETPRLIGLEECKKFETWDIRRKICFAQYGASKKDISACNVLSGNVLEERICIGGVAGVKREPELCLSLPSPVVEETIGDPAPDNPCPLGYGYLTADLESCSQFQSIWYGQEFCQYGVALSKEDPKLCKSKDTDCYVDIVVLKGDETICEQADYSSDCYHGLLKYRDVFKDKALFRNLEELCKKVESLNKSLYPYTTGLCYKNIALIENNGAFCDKAGGFKDGCYRDLAEKTNDPSLCEKAGKEKERCYKQFKKEAKQVIITTDKTEYEQGETIKITIKNGLNESIFSQIGSHTPVFAIEYIEKYTLAGDWQKLFAQCQYPNCIYEIDVAAEIKPGQSETFEWEPLIYINGTSEHTKLDPGRYRLSILYEDYKKMEWKSIYSNEFTIREETACEKLYEKIENDFERANYCEISSDCKAIQLGGSYIEFGCFKYVNKEVDENEFLKRVQEYDGVCEGIIDECAPTPNGVCDDGKCRSPKEGETCISNNGCLDIDCSKYNSPVKSGYSPYCVDNKCQCMCYGCE